METTQENFIVLDNLSHMLSSIMDRASHKAEAGTFDPVTNKETNRVDIELNNRLIDSILVTLIRDKAGI